MKNILLVLIFFSIFTSPVLSQDYSIRTNVLNLFAKGPSIAFGKNLKNHSEILLTYSSGNFEPFFTVDSYKYSTVHAEYRYKDNSFGTLQFYCGGYLRYINKKIISEGYTAGPFGLFSKASRDFIGNGISTGVTSGAEIFFSKKWFVDFNTFIGAGKYLTQIDYSGHDAIGLFFDIRIALQIGFKF